MRVRVKNLLRKEVSFQVSFCDLGVWAEGEREMGRVFQETAAKDFKRRLESRRWTVWCAGIQKVRVSEAERRVREGV